MNALVGMLAFLLGGALALLGAGLGGLWSGWAAWTGALLASALIGALSERPAAWIGGVLVAAAIGAAQVGNPLAAAGMALLSLLIAGLPYLPPLLTLLRERRRRAKGAAPSSGPSDDRALLSEERVERLLTLARKDPEAFRRLVRRLTPEQREQLRAAWSRRNDPRR